MEQKNKTKYEYLYPWLPGNAPEDLSDEQLLKDFLFYKIQYVDGDPNSNEIKDKLFDLKDEIDRRNNEGEQTDGNLDK
ncbi:MAG: hypothetical protein K6G26_13475 [Lachnospiraceae bacterium]|nr:hypothetical protein [Lachnospiraceae bacterium]